MRIFSELQIYQGFMNREIPVNLDYTINVYWIYEVYVLSGLSYATIRFSCYSSVSFWYDDSSLSSLCIRSLQTTNTLCLEIRIRNYYRIYGCVPSIWLKLSLDIIKYSYLGGSTPVTSTMPSDIEDDDLDNQQEVLHQDQAHRDMTIRTTRVPRQRNGAVPLLSLPALHFRSGPSHHHCSNAENQPSTNLASLTLYRCSRFPRPVETRMFLNQRPVEITTFGNTKWLLLR